MFRSVDQPVPMSAAFADVGALSVALSPWDDTPYAAYRTLRSCLRSILIRKRPSEFERSCLLLRVWRRAIGKRNRGRGIVRWLAFMCKRDAAQGHTNEKHYNDHQNHYAVLSWRTKSARLLIQKFLVALVHFEISIARTCPYETREKRCAFRFSSVVTHSYTAIKNCASESRSTEGDGVRTRHGCGYRDFAGPGSVGKAAYQAGQTKAAYQPGQTRGSVRGIDP